MDTRGRHILMEMWNCDVEILNDKSKILAALSIAVEVSGAHAISWICRDFEPQGVTAVMVVEESHFSIHTWPESGYAAIDAFTCGTTCDPMKSVDVLRKSLRAKNVEVKEILRGIPEGALNLKSM